jgi:hypothetical protein
MGDSVAFPHVHRKNYVGWDVTHKDSSRQAPVWPNWVSLLVALLYAVNVSVPDYLVL